MTRPSREREAALRIAIYTLVPALSYLALGFGMVRHWARWMEG